MVHLNHVDKQKPNHHKIRKKKKHKELFTLIISEIPLSVIHVTNVQNPYSIPLIKIGIYKQKAIIRFIYSSTLEPQCNLD